MFLYSGDTSTSTYIQKLDGKKFERYSSKILMPKICNKLEEENAVLKRIISI